MSRYPFIIDVPENLLDKPGIYQITNTIDGKKYIGQTKKIGKRLRQHQCKCCNPHLRRAYKKHGAENFVATVVLVCEPDQLTHYETALVGNGHDRDDLYNIVPPGDSPLSVPAIRQQHKQIMKKRWSDLEWRRRHTEVMKAVSAKPQWLESVREAAKRRKGDPVWQRTMANANRLTAQCEEWRTNKAKQNRELAKDPSWKKANEDGAKRRRRPIEYKPPRGRVWKTYNDGAWQFSLRHGLNASSISLVLNGLRSHTKGYKFRYPETDLQQLAA